MLLQDKQKYLYKINLKKNYTESVGFLSEVFFNIYSLFDTNMILS